MLVLGGALYGFGLVRGGLGPDERPRIVVPPHRLELMFEGFVADNYRPPTPEERERLIEDLIDEEVLYQYALVLGMHEHPAAQRRLALIAEFVEAQPHEAPSQAERAAAAMELGLHHGDLVVRRILVDSARRLIRGVVLLQQPDEASVREYFAAHGRELARPARVRLSHVAINGFKWPDSETRAREVLERIRAGSLRLDQALALGDETPVASRLPALSEQALETRFGHELARRAMDLPPGRWAGPIPSRYGHHLVWVHERFEPAVPSLEEVREWVEDRVRHELADRWLAKRLLELRQEFEIVVPGRMS